MSAAGRDRSALGARRRWPGAGLLLVLYPAAWRRRYGDELDALILDMAAGEGTARWRVRADLVGSAARLRLLGDGNPDRRIRGGASLVLWAWALFVLAGALVAKTSEHWQQALPRHGGGGAQAAFDVLTFAAIACAVLVAVGIAVALPAAARFLRDGGWWLVRRRALIAVALSAAVVPALVAIILWAHGLTPAQRNGHDALYGLAIVSWALLGAACLLAWTAVATRIARELRCRRGVLTAQALISGVVALAMAAMTVATLTWWVITAHDQGAPLGGSTAAYVTALVPQLAFAAVLMVVATGIAAIGAARADTALAEL